MATYYLLINSSNALYWATNPFVSDEILLETPASRTPFWQAGSVDPPGVSDEWTPRIDSTTDAIAWALYNA